MGDTGLRRLHGDSDIALGCLEIGDDWDHLGQPGNAQHFQHRGMIDHQDEGLLAQLRILEVPVDVSQSSGIHERDVRAVEDECLRGVACLIQ